MTGHGGEDETRLGADFGLDSGMLYWALSVVRTMQADDARIAQWLSKGSHLDRAAAEAFILRARHLLTEAFKTQSRGSGDK